MRFTVGILISALVLSSVLASTDKSVDMWDFNCQNDPQSRLVRVRKFMMVARFTREGFMKAQAVIKFLEQCPKADQDPKTGLPDKLVCPKHVKVAIQELQTYLATTELKEEVRTAKNLELRYIQVVCASK